MTDFVINKDRHVAPGYWILYQDSRQTFKNEKSPFVNGKLMKRENSIHRQWRSVRGIPPCTLVTAHNGSQSVWSNGGYATRFPNDQIMGQLVFMSQQDAITRFHQKASNQAMKLAEYILDRASVKRSVIDLFKALVEIRESLKAKRLFKTIYGKHNSRKRVEMSLAEKWLSYSFMWKPLINDCYTLLAGFEPVTSGNIRVRGRNSKTVQLPPITDSQSVSHCTENYEARVSIVGAVRITDPLLALLDEIGLADPFQIMWDKLPFSFVVDWFVNIGKMVDQACMPGKEIVNPSLTVLTKFSSNSYGWTIAKPPNNGKVSNIGSGIECKHVVYQRTLQPVPLLSVQIAGGINSLWHLSTTLALS